MKVVSTFTPPSSVVASLRCSLAPSTQHLVVAKSDRIDVFSQQATGLHLECTVPIWGRIVALSAIRLHNNGVQRILVMTDHPEPCLFILSPSLTADGVLVFDAPDHISLHERIGRPAEFFTGLVVNASETIAVASVYTGKLRVLDFRTGGPNEGFDVNVPELNILSLCFVPSDEETPVVAILHRDYQQRVQLLSRELNIESFDLSVEPAVLLQPTLLSSTSFPQADTPPILVPVTATNTKSEENKGVSEDFSGGVVVIGGKKMILHRLAPTDWQEKKKAKQKRESQRKGLNAADLAKAREKEAARRNMKRKPFCSVEWPFGEITGWTRIDEDRLLVGDAFGKLAMLVLRRSQSDMLLIIPMGETSPSTTLSYLDGNLVFVGSHYGDSQIVRIHSGPLPGTTPLSLPVDIVATSITTASPESTNSKGKQRAVDMDAESTSNRGMVAKMDGTVVEVVQTIPGLSPIVDAVIADVDSSGQPQLVVCSGGQGAGAIKVVRKGAELQEHVVVDGFENITHVWPLRPTSAIQDDHTHLLVSTLTSTFFLQLSVSVDDPILRLADSSSHQFVTNKPTIAAANMADSSTTAGSAVVQVTHDGVIVVKKQHSMAPYTLVHHWLPENEPHAKGRQIVAASISIGRIALALSGGTVLLLRLDQDQKCITEGSIGVSISPFNTDTPREISAISITPMDLVRRRSQFIVVSCWETNEVVVLRHATTTERYTDPAQPDESKIRMTESRLVLVMRTGPHPSCPRSLLLYNFGKGRVSHKKVEEEDTGREITMLDAPSDYLPYLLVGMADGTLASYALDADKTDGEIVPEITLADRKIVSLGTTPVSLTVMEMEGGVPAVCACGSRASFFFHGQGRLQQSPVLVNGVAAIACVRLQNIPATVVVATSKALSFGSFGRFDQTHIRSSNLGLETPTSVAWHPELAVFGVACNRVRPSRVGEYFVSSNSSLKLLDGGSLDVVDHVACNGEVTALSTVSLKVEGSDEVLTKFCASTVSSQENNAPCNGQVLIFNVHPKDATSGKMLTVMSRMDVQGCIYAITSVNGLLAVAKDSSVTILRLEQFGTTDYRLIKLHEWNHNYVITSLSPLPSGQGLALGDAINSVSVLTIENNMLKTAARDNTPLWPVSVSALDDQTVIGVNTDCNFFSYRLSNANQGHALDSDGSWYLGDFVNRLIPGAVVQVKESRFKPKQLFFSSTGRIGLVSIVEETDLSLELIGLQRNMAQVLTGTGNVQHTKYRAPANARGRSDAQPEARGFLDGDFLEQYLSYGSESKEVKAMLQGANDAEKVKISEPEMRKILEGLQSLH